VSRFCSAESVIQVETIKPRVVAGKFSKLQAFVEVSFLFFFFSFFLDAYTLSGQDAEGVFPCILGNEG
jgi:hypothetical protein